MDVSRFAPKKLITPGIALLVLVLLVTFPLYSPSYSLVLFAAIFMFIVLTVSWTIFSGPTGYMSLAPAAFFGLGIYTAATLGKTVPMPVFVLIAGVVCFVLALLVGAVTLRLKGVYFAIFTFGLVVLIKELMLFWEIEVTGTRGRFVVLESNETIYFTMLVILVLTLLTAYFIRHSRFGLALQSIGENEEAAAHIGINVTWVKIIAFAISAIFMGASGAIMATRWTYVDPYVAFNPLFSFLPVLMALFGGMGQFYGPIIGATIFAYLEEVLLTKFPYYYMLTFGIILIIVILYMPGGLAGFIEKWRKGGLAKQGANTRG